jgi:hypothetical protein
MAAESYICHSLIVYLHVTGESYRAALGTLSGSSSVGLYLQWGSVSVGELKEWIKYWRKTISKCVKIHKDSAVHKAAYAELSGYLTEVEAYAEAGELSGAVLSAVAFMQRMHELERSIGMHVLDKKVPGI